MNLAVLGRYTPYPPAGGACPSYLITHGKTQILVDCGSGAVAKMLELTHWDRLSAVMLSHLHGDHMSDMMVLRYAVAESQRNGTRDRPLSVYCPDEPQDVRLALDYSNAFQIQPIAEAETIRVGEVSISFAKTVHSLPCYSMKFEAGGRTIVYSGDTEQSDTLQAFAAGADVFLCEATYLEDLVGRSHLSARQAGALARRAGVKRLIVTHFATMNGAARTMALVRETFPEAEEAKPGVWY